MNPLPRTQMCYNATRLSNGYNVRGRHVPPGCNYGITDNKLNLPRRVPHFSSEGQARGVATNYRFHSSPGTWYLNGQAPPAAPSHYVIC